MMTSEPLLAQRQASEGIPVRRCRSCDSDQLTTVLSLGAMPLTAAFRRPEQRGQPERRYPLAIAFCAECALVQITHAVPAEVIFSKDYPYYSSFSDELLRHSRENAERLTRERGLTKDSLVVELASNDGYLLKNFVEWGVPVLGIDPAEGPAGAAIAAGIPTLCAFFGADMATDLRREGRAADVIIANNVLAHVPDLNGFVAGMGILLKDDGVIVIECPYVREMIERCEFDTIYHEHLCYFSVTALDRLFRRHGLFLNDIEHYPIHGGSLRLFVGKQEQVSPTVRAHLRDEAQRGMTAVGYYEDFAARVAGIRRDLGALLGNLKGQGRSIAAYGAAAKGIILLNYLGLPTGVLDYVVDRNVHKQGQYLPGIDLLVRPPEALRETLPDYTLLLAWNFTDEVLRQQQAYRDEGGRFIVPIPTPVIV